MMKSNVKQLEGTSTNTAFLSVPVEDKNALSALSKCKRWTLSVMWAEEPWAIPQPPHLFIADSPFSK